MQLFVSIFDFVHIIPMKRQKDMHHSLKQMFKTVGVPAGIICDGTKGQVQVEARKLVNKVNSHIKE
jgi:hypothetical protein